MSGEIPILRLGEILLAGLPGELDDTGATAFTSDLADRIDAQRTRGVLLDISALEIIDSFVARMLMDLTTMARLLGARVVVAGMRPAVAITLVELGLPLPGVETYLTAEHAYRGLVEETVRPGGEGQAGQGGGPVPLSGAGGGVGSTRMGRADGRAH